MRAARRPGPYQSPDQRVSFRGPIDLAIISLFAITLAACSSGGSVPTDLIEYIPADAMMVVLVDMEAVVEEVSKDTPFGDVLEDIRDDTGEYMEATLGVDLASVSQLALFSTPSGAFGMVAEGDFDGTMTGETVTIEGVEMGLFGDLLVGVHNDLLVLGNVDGVTAALGVIKGGDPSLASVASNPLSALIEDGSSSGTVLIAMTLDESPLGGLIPMDLDMTAVSAVAGPETLSLRVRTGSESEANTALSTIETGISMGLAMIGSQVEQLKSSDEFDAEALTMIAGLHMAQYATDEMLDFDTDGADLVVEVSLEGMGGVVPLLGVGASVAIPAFLQYIDRSRTTEAQQNLRRLADYALSYYQTEHTTATGDLLPAQFPTSTFRTPLEVPCGEKAPPTDEWFNNPTWSSLNFGISDPHFYSYQFESGGEGDSATFTAYAFGDLDCDGLLSTFRREGYVSYGTQEVETLPLWSDFELE